MSAISRRKSAMVQPSEVHPYIQLRFQFILSLYSFINYSRTMTVLSLRLVAKFLNDFADKLEDQQILKAVEKDVIEEVNDKYDVSDTKFDTKEDLDAKYNQLLLSTHQVLQQESIAKISDGNLVPNIVGRWRNDSVDSGLSDMDFVDIDEATGLTIISLAEVADHSSFDDAWTVIYDKVYDVTDYLDLHPGGQEVLLEYVGYDSTVAFRGVAHSKAAFRSLDKYCVGILPESERLNYDPNL